MEQKDLINQLDRDAPEKIASTHIVDAGEIAIADIEKVEKLTSKYSDDDGTTQDVDRFYLTVKGKDKPIKCPKSVMTNLNAIIKAMTTQGKVVVAFSAIRIGTGKASKYSVSPRMA